MKNLKKDKYSMISQCVESKKYNRLVNITENKQHCKSTILQYKIKIFLKRNRLIDIEDSQI